MFDRTYAAASGRGALPRLGWIGRISARYIAIGLLCGAVAACDSGEERAQSHFERGQELAAEGDHVKATLEFRNAIRLNQQFTEAHFGLASALIAQGDLASGIANFR